MREGGESMLDSECSDNTISALQVVEHTSEALGWLVHGFPCATHITALFGKNSILQMAGGDPERNWDKLHPLNLVSKQWYITNQYYGELKPFWIKLGFSEELWVHCQRGLLGKLKRLGDRW